MPPTFIEMRPSCGMRRSAMLMSAMTFRRLITPAWIAARRAHHLVEHAVDAEPDAQVVLGRLDVDVGRAVVHRLA